MKTLSNLFPAPVSAASARRFFALFAVAYFLAWAVLGTVAQGGLQYYDAYETAMAARRWLVATFKHPGLSFDFLHLLFALFGKSVCVVHCAAIAWSILGLWAAWRLSREFVSERLALLVVLATATYRYFGFRALNYTPSSPGPALTLVEVLAFYFAATRGKTRYWVALGAVFAANVFAKYSAGIDIATLFAFSLLNRRARRCWRTPGPWATVATFALLVAPLLAFFVRYKFDFATYPESCLVAAPELGERFGAATGFVFKQIYFFIPIGVALFPLTDFFWRFRSVRRNAPSDAERAERPASDDDLAFGAALTTFALWVPAAILTALAFCFAARWRDAYGAPVWSLYGVWLVASLRLNVSAKAIRRAALCSAAILIAQFAGFVAFQAVVFNFATKPHLENWPTRGFGRIVDDVWAEYVPNDADGPAVLSGDWKAIGPAFLFARSNPDCICYYRDDPNELSDPNVVPTVPFPTDDDLNARGGLILWDAEPGEPLDATRPDWLKLRYPSAFVVPKPFVVPYRSSRPDRAPTVTIRAAVVLPPDANSL